MESVYEKYEPATADILVEVAYCFKDGKPCYKGFEELLADYRENAGYSMAELDAAAPYGAALWKSFESTIKKLQNFNSIRYVGAGRSFDSPYRATFEAWMYGKHVVSTFENKHVKFDY